MQKLITPFDFEMVLWQLNKQRFSMSSVPVATANFFIIYLKTEFKHSVSSHNDLISIGKNTTHIIMLIKVTLLV